MLYEVITIASINDCIISLRKCEKLMAESTEKRVVSSRATVGTPGTSPGVALTDSGTDMIRMATGIRDWECGKARINSSPSGIHSYNFV